MKKLLLLAIVAATFVPCAFALPPATQDSKVNVAVAAEAGLTVPSDATLTSGSLFANYTGNSTFTYYIRTTEIGGTGNIQLKVSADFAPAGGPSVLGSVTSGDTLTYVSAPVSPATAPPLQTASTTTGTAVASFGAAAHSTKTTGNSGNTVAWTLINDPSYAVNTYSATVTWTISAT